jgi:hypothetical protein
LLIAAAIVLLPPHPPQVDASGPRQPPDLPAKPTWGAAIDLAGLVDGEFDSVDFKGFLGDHTGLVLAQNDWALEEGEPPRADAPIAAVAGFDPDSGERRWQVDIDGSLSQGFASATFGDFMVDPRGMVAVSAFGESGGGQSHPTATIGAQGEVMSVTDDIGGQLLGLGTGVLLIWDNTPGYERQSAYRAEDLSQPVWEAYALPDSLDTTTFNLWTGTYWTAPEARVISVDTGQPTALRRNLAGGAHLLANGPYDLVLRWEGRDGKAMRVDPQTGEPLWGSPVEDLNPDQRLEVREDTLLTGPTTADAADTIWARDAATGRGLWTATGTVGAVRGRTALILNGSSIATRDLRTGRQFAHTRITGRYRLVGVGAKTVYIQVIGDDRRELAAYSLDGLNKLWSLDSAVQASDHWIWYRWTDNRLFAEFSSDHDHVIRQLVPAG